MKAFILEGELCRVLEGKAVPMCLKFDDGRQAMMTGNLAPLELVGRRVRITIEVLEDK